MRKLRVGIIDVVSRGQTRTLYARLMHANLASIMPQVLAVWAEELGHDVELGVGQRVLGHGHEARPAARTTARRPVPALLYGAKKTRSRFTRRAHGRNTDSAVAPVMSGSALTAVWRTARWRRTARR